MFFSLHPLSVKMAGVFCFTRHRNDAMFFIAISIHSSSLFRCALHLHFDAFSISIPFVGMLFSGLKRGDACGEWRRMDESLCCLFVLRYFFSQCSVSQARTGVS